MSAVAAFASSSFKLFFTISNTSILSPACSRAEERLRVVSGSPGCGSAIARQRRSQPAGRSGQQAAAALHGEPPMLLVLVLTSQSLKPSTDTPHSVPAATSRTSSLTRRSEDSGPCSRRKEGSSAWGRKGGEQGRGSEGRQGVQLQMQVCCLGTRSRAPGHAPLQRRI